MADIYLSYASGDSPFAEEFANRFRSIGYSVFTDAQLEPGTNFARRIEQEIESASCVVSLWTEQSGESEWVRAEATMGLDGNKLVVVQCAPDARIALPFSMLDIIRYPAEWEKLVTAVAQLVGRAPMVQPAPTPQAPRNRGFAFISSVAEDAHHKNALASFLGERGYGYWDYGSSKRQYDAHLFDEIEERIKESALALIIVSNDWKKSKWAFREFYFCEELKKPYFLLRFEPMEPTLAISGIPRIDLGPDLDQGLKMLGAELKAAGL